MTTATPQLLLDVSGRQAALCTALETLFEAWAEEEAGAPRPAMVARRVWRAYRAAWSGLDAETAREVYRVTKAAHEARTGHCCVHSGEHVAICGCPHHREEA